MLATDPNDPPRVTKPLPVLVKLGLATKDERWRARESIYGCRRSKRKWETLRDETASANAKRLSKMGRIPGNLYSKSDRALYYRFFGN